MGDGRKEKTVNKDGYTRAPIRGEADLNVSRYLSVGRQGHPMVGDTQIIAMLLPSVGVNTLGVFAGTNSCPNGKWQA